MVRLQQNIARRSGQDRGSEAAEPHEAAEATSSSATGVEVMGPQLVGAPPTPEPTHFLLYLNKRTFLDGAGTALADEVRAALAAGLPIAMIHEKDRHTPSGAAAPSTRSSRRGAPALPLPRSHSVLIRPATLAIADAARPARPQPVQGARHRVRGRPGATRGEPHGVCRIDWRRQEHRCASDAADSGQAE